MAEAECMEPMDVPQTNSDQPFPWPKTPPEESEVWRADELAAAAMSADLSKWIVFDPSESDIDQLENFLQINSPSAVQRCVEKMCVKKMCKNRHFK